MTCAEFDATLADLLAGPGGSSDPRPARLRAHAATCSACASAIDLIDLAARPVSERDPVADPGEAYWNAFGERLAGRLAGGPSRRSRSLAVGRGLAAAAAVVAVGLLVVALRRAPVVAPSAPADVSPTIPSPQGAFRSETAIERRPIDDGVAIDDDLAEGFAGGETLDAFAEDDDGGLFPETDRLAPADAKRLLEWLTQEESRVRKGAA